MTSNDDVLCGNNWFSMSGASVTVTLFLEHGNERHFCPALTGAAPRPE